MPGLSKYLLLLALLLPWPTHATTLPPPRCAPTASNFHTQVTDGVTYSLLWCDDSVGLGYWAAVGSAADPTEWQCVTQLPPFKLDTSWLAQAWGRCVTRDLTPAEMANVNQMAAKWVPRLTVAAGANQPIYLAINADLSRFVRWVNGGVNMSVAPGQWCKWGPRLKTPGRYYRVEWLLSANNFTIPTGGYALCQIAYPPTDGWAP